jgi:hypothetical protein
VGGSQACARSEHECIHDLLVIKKINDSRKQRQRNNNSIKTRRDRKPSSSYVAHHVGQLEDKAPMGID